MHLHLCNDHCLDIVVIIWSSINCPTVICSPTVCYFSREKPLVKSTAPGSLLYYICLQSTFICIFYFQIYITKKPKIPRWILFAVVLFATTKLYLYQSFTREGLTAPLTRGVASICSLCVGTVYIAWLGPPTGLILWMCCIIPSSLGKYWRSF